MNTTELHPLIRAVFDYNTGGQFVFNAEENINPRESLGVLNGDFTADESVIIYEGFNIDAESFIRPFVRHNYTECLESILECRLIAEGKFRELKINSNIKPHLNALNKVYKKLCATFGKYDTECNEKLGRVSEVLDGEAFNRFYLFYLICKKAGIENNAIKLAELYSYIANKPISKPTKNSALYCNIVLKREHTKNKEKAENVLMEKFEELLKELKISGTRQ